jgi:uncharacterized membrane protein (UPF0127 family)
MNVLEKAVRDGRHQGAAIVQDVEGMQPVCRAGGSTFRNTARRGPLLRLRIADTFVARLLGLHADGPLAQDEGILLRPCGAVHTLFLRAAVDVVFLDGGLRECRRISGLAPQRLAWQRGARSVVELQAGYCTRHPDYLDRIRAAVHAAQTGGC